MVYEKGKEIVEKNDAREVNGRRSDTTSRMMKKRKNHIIKYYTSRNNI